MSRKLDAAIADALGYEVVNGWAEKVENGLLDRREIPKYSTDGNAMLELIGELKKIGFQIRFADAGGLHTDLPRAVAKAVYHLLTGKEYQEESEGERISE